MPKAAVQHPWVVLPLLYTAGKRWGEDAALAAESAVAAVGRVLERDGDKASTIVTWPNRK